MVQQNACVQPLCTHGGGIAEIRHQLHSCVAPVPGEAYDLGMHGTLRSRSLSELHDLLLHHSLDFLGEVGFQGFLVFLGSISRGRRSIWLPGSDFLG